MMVIVGLVAFVASALTFVSGFGLGTLLMPVFAVFMPVERAVALTGVLSSVLQSQYNVPTLEAFAPVAFLIGALGNGWRPVFEAIGGAFGRIFGGGK